jgi:hypothetical protein
MALESTRAYLRGCRIGQHTGRATDAALTGARGGAVARRISVACRMLTDPREFGRTSLRLAPLQVAMVLVKRPAKK